MNLTKYWSGGKAKRRRAFTLPEVVISVAISAIAIGGIIYGYIISARRAEWSGYSLAAHAAALQVLERTKAAKWDPSRDPVVDMLTTANFPEERVLMDIPITGTNMVYGINKINIYTISTSPHIKMIRVDCEWPFMNGRIYTNTVVTYRSPGV
ncbi:MAG TPA: prepilin-type N-terminal cleavage/methylation domain-containing protein [Verrucomicrobiae bacterium]